MMCRRIFSEGVSIALSMVKPSAEYLKNVRGLLFDRNSSFTASMLRDMEAGGPIEGEHIIGDMYHRARDAGLDAHLLRVAYCHLQAYEARRAKKAAVQG